MINEKDQESIEKTSNRAEENNLIREEFCNFVGKWCDKWKLSYETFKALNLLMADHVFMRKDR